MSLKRCRMRYYYLGTYGQVLERVSATFQGDVS